MPIIPDDSKFDNMVPLEEAITARNSVAYKGDWLSINKIECNDIILEYVHELACKGIMVGILPFRYDSAGKLLFLYKKEIILPWSKHPQYTAFVNGFDGVSLFSSLISLLQNEAGIIVENNSFIYLGNLLPSRISDTLFYLYGLEVAPTMPITIMDDVEWLPDTPALLSLDAVANTIFARLSTFFVHRIRTFPTLTEQGVKYNAS